MMCRLLMLLIIVINDVTAYVELIGAGATAPVSVYVPWMAAYRSSRKQFVDVRLSYIARGSGFGKRAIVSRTVNYAGSDSLLSEADYEKNPDLQMFPSIALSIVLTYNVPGITNLVLTREQIVGIYNGSINNWNDPTFAEHNPGVDLPDATIVPIARYDYSGSTEIFTRSLSSFSDAWTTQYGIFSSRTGWNASVVKLFGERTSGVADAVHREPYRIGYVTPASAVEVNLPYASVINQHGSATMGDKRSVQAAMDERLHSMTSRLTSNLVDCEDQETYPIVGYSYFIVHMKQEGNCSVAIELARYVDWFITSSQAEAEAENNLKVTVSSTVANRIRSVVLEQMTCDGQLLMDLVRQQKYEEEESLKTWKLPVQIVSPLVAFIIVLLVAYAVVQRIRYCRMLNRDDWKINFFEIDLVVPKKRRHVNGGTDAADNDESSENCPGRWNIHDVVAKPLSIAMIFDVNWKVKQALMRMREEIQHDNVARFFGISSHTQGIYLVEQNCAGTLVDFFGESKYSVNQSLRYVACADIANGMAYLHHQNLIHGNLSIDKCHVDSRWTIKIVDWEYAALYDVVRRTDGNKTRDTRHRSVLHFLCDKGSRPFRHLAPEIQKNGELFEPTSAGDVYSFGIIIQDLFVILSGHEHREAGVSNCNEMPAKARQIMELACHVTAIKRPTFEQMEKSMRSAVGSGQNFLDSIIEMMEEYTNELEDRLRKTNHGDRKLVPDDIALNVEPVNSEPSCTLDNFTDSRLAVMMMRVDSATAESRNDCSFVEMVRKVAMSVVGEVIFMEEGRNSMIVAVAPNTSRSTGTPVTQLLMITGRVIKEMAIWSPLMKLQAVMHVGSVSGVAHSTSQTPQLEPLNNSYELFGSALDVCRQIMNQTAWTTKQYAVKVTKDAVDDDVSSFASLTLGPASSCYMDDAELATFYVRHIGTSIISSSDVGAANDANTSTKDGHILTNVDC